MEKTILYYLLTIIFFVIYILVFDYFYKALFSNFVAIDYGLLLFLLQIGISIVILFPASVATTNKVFEIIRSS